MRRWQLCLFAAIMLLSLSFFSVQVAPAQEATPTAPAATWTPGVPVDKTPIPVVDPGAAADIGLIQLRVRHNFDPAADGISCPELWTWVEWLGQDGAWRRVEGWQGPLEECSSTEGRKAWWADRSQLGRGPFRWLVYDREGGELLAVSAEFYIPDFPGRIVQLNGEGAYPLLPASGGEAFALIALVLVGLVAVSALPLALRSRGTVTD